MPRPEVCVPFDDVLDIARLLNVLVVSLERIGSADAATIADTEWTEQLARDIEKRPDGGSDDAAGRFLTEWDMTRRLSIARTLLLDALRDAISDDAMEDLEESVFERDPIWVEGDSQAPPPVGPPTDHPRPLPRILD